MDDDGFVRAPVALVYRRLTHIGAWAEWWPGLRVVELDARPDEDECWQLTWWDGWRRMRVRAHAHGWRHEAGFKLRLEGAVEGDAEFWLERGYGGTVVHHLLVGRTHRRRPLAVLRSYRRNLRRGLWAFKDLVQSEVRADAGLLP